MIFGLEEKNDNVGPYNVLLGIATNIPCYFRLVLCFRVTFGSHKCSQNKYCAHTHLKQIKFKKYHKCKLMNYVMTNEIKFILKQIIEKPF